jgi:HK97 family phage portal protein
MAGFLSRLFGRTAPVETRDASGMTASFAHAFGLYPTPAGRFLSATGAENLAAVMAAVSAISSTTASLTPLTFRRTATGREELPTAHWLARLMKAPSEQFSYFEWAESLVSDCLLRGNALCEIVHDRSGRVTALEPIGWHRVAVSILPTGRVCYDIAPPDGSPRTGQTRRLFAEDVFHLRDRTNSGEIVAKSRLARAAGAVQNVASLQEMSLSVWEKGIKPSGYVTYPNILSKDARKEMAEVMRGFQGSTQSGRVPVLENGTVFHSLGIDAESAQTLESRKFGIYEIARIMQIPPPLLQSYEYNSYSNAEQASKWYGQHTIAPWALRITSALGRCVLGPNSDLSVELDLSSLLKGSELERWQSFKIAKETGALSADEIRGEFGWGPRTEPQPAAPPVEEPQGP